MFAAKSLRVCEQDALEKINKVRSRLHDWIKDLPANSRLEILQGSYSFQASETSKHLVY